MREIEISSRLYQENGALFMTATVMTQVDAESPETEPVTFVLIGQRLATIRYANPLPFRVFATQVQRQSELAISGETRACRPARRHHRPGRRRAGTGAARYEPGLADDLLPAKDRLSRRYSAPSASPKGLTSRSRESLVSIGRVLSFLSRPSEVKPNKALARSLKTLSRDVLALSDHSNFLANNITFLLNAMLGMSNIEQTDIIKIFSVMSVLFLPPTLIASIYGMNFQFMPELGWPFGYPLSIVLMMLSGVAALSVFQAARVAVGSVAEPLGLGHAKPIGS